MATINSTHAELTRVFRQELKERTLRLRNKLMKELEERFHTELIKIAANITLELDHYYSVEKLQDDVRVTLQVKS